MSPTVICEGAKRPSGGGSGRGCPRPGEICIWSPKTVSEVYFGKRLLEYDFLQIERGQDDIFLGLGKYVRILPFLSGGGGPHHILKARENTCTCTSKYTSPIFRNFSESF